MGIYMQDYGGPIGNRIIARYPDWLQWQIIQNANSYVEGFTPVWDGIRHALWADRNPETEAPLVAFLEPDTVRTIYTTGHNDLSKISPDRTPSKPPGVSRDRNWFWSIEEAISFWGAKPASRRRSRPSPGRMS
jgi:hypothetical protein